VKLAGRLGGNFQTFISGIKERGRSLSTYKPVERKSLNRGGGGGGRLTGGKKGSKSKTILNWTSKN